MLCVIYGLAGCAGPKRVDAARFQEFGAQIGTINSAVAYELLPVENGRARIRFTTVITLSGREKTVIYWTPLSELSAPVQNALRSGLNPWNTPPPDRTFEQFRTAPLEPDFTQGFKW